MGKMKQFLNKGITWKLRLFLVLFVLLSSPATVSNSNINVHGLFGEITTSVVDEQQKENAREVATKKEYDSLRKAGINIYNIWFEILFLIIVLRCVTYVKRLPRGYTIVTLKVRMDN